MMTQDKAALLPQGTPGTTFEYGDSNPPRKSYWTPFTAAAEQKWHGSRSPITNPSPHKTFAAYCLSEKGVQEQTEHERYYGLGMDALVSACS